MTSSTLTLMLAAGALALLHRGAVGQAPPPRSTIPIETGARLELINVEAEPVTYHGRKAIRLTEARPGTERAHGHSVAIAAGTELGDGTIEVDLAGVPGPTAAPDDRGFIGIAFRVQPGGERFQTFYLRPTNGRADDQVRRNHATQYTAEPDWPWHRLRREEPGKYESYVDLAAGEWTAVKVVLSGSRAELYVNGATQPALVVTDLKSTDGNGGVALWIGQGTVGHFANLRVSPKPR